MKGTIGIDPGLSGAIACLAEDGTLRVWDLPLRIASKTRKRNGKGKMVEIIREELDGVALATILDGLEGEVFIEKVQSMSKQGVTSMFNFGVSFGVIRGTVTALWGEEPKLVTPQKWKKALGVTSSKEVTGGKALELFPGYDSLWFGPSGGLMDGRFEAALIAYYGRNLDV